jgi:hypothetical protein
MADASSGLAIASEAAEEVFTPDERFSEFGV